jgi:hypothetical protein
MVWMLLSLLSLGAATAQDCDAAALTARTKDASPTALAEIFVELAACDQAKAKKAVPTIVPRLVSGEGTPAALVAAIRLGESGAVRSWLASQEPDVRSQAIAKIGRSCAEVPAVADFFVKAHAEVGPAFWEERWHRGLADCRYPAVQSLLADALTGEQVGRTSRNRSGYFALLEVYARNLRAGAIPKLQELLREPRDEEEAVFVVTVFANAANVGGQDGQDAAASAAAVTALEQVAPTLPYKALDRARGTMIALGEPARASMLAKFAWPELYGEAGYTYSVSAIEDITCRNGSRRAVLHVGTFTEKGALWPDELQGLISDRVKKQWALAGAERCRGTSEITVAMSPGPLDAAGLEAWRKEAEAAFRKRFSTAKIEVVAEEGFGY